MRIAERVLGLLVYAVWRLVLCPMDRIDMWLRKRPKAEAKK